jgi:hypothetical protein
MNTLSRDMSVEVLGATELPSFSIEDYFAKRDAQADFLMVEFGHGGSPTAYYQPNGFFGGRAYIGVEAWLRGNEDWINGVRSRMADRAMGQNIFYIPMDIGGTVHREPVFDGPDELSYKGPFDTVTSLPDETVDEIYASNVFCDPMVAFSPARTNALLGEMSRLLAPGGMLVTRETATPRCVRVLTDECFASHGLERVAFERLEDSPHWDMLEDRHSGIETRQWRHPKSDSFYLFVRKKVDQAAAA